MCSPFSSKGIRVQMMFIPCSPGHDWNTVLKNWSDLSFSVFGPLDFFPVFALCRWSLCRGNNRAKKLDSKRISFIISVWFGVVAWLTLGFLPNCSCHQNQRINAWLNWKSYDLGNNWIAVILLYLNDNYILPVSLWLEMLRVSLVELKSGHTPDARKTWDILQETIFS